VAESLDSGGNVLSASMFDAYGATLAGGLGPFGFAAQSGYYLDSETGLYLLGHRYYDSSQGRFLNRDPSGYNGGMNLYGYANQDPVNLGDPLGLNPMPWGTSSGFSLSLGPSDYPWLVFDNDSVYNGLTQGFRNGQVVSGFIAEAPIPTVSYVGQIGSSVSGFGSLVMKGISGSDGDAGVNSGGGIPRFIHRGGGSNPGSWKPRNNEAGFSCWDDPSKILPGKDEHVTIDTSLLPPGSVTQTLQPGHYEINISMVPDPRFAISGKGKLSELPAPEVGGGVTE